MKIISKQFLNGDGLAACFGRCSFSAESLSQSEICSTREKQVNGARAIGSCCRSLFWRFLELRSTRWSISRSRSLRSSFMSQFTWEFVGEAHDGKGKMQQ